MKKLISAIKNTRISNKEFKYPVLIWGIFIMSVYLFVEHPFLKFKLGTIIN